MDLIKAGVNYVIQEAIIVTKNIFRKYPMKYEGIIPTLCEHLEILDEPDAKAALIWIIGEYAERIENASTLLEHFLQDFKLEKEKVQLQLLTCTVKLFLKKPENCHDLVQKVLQDATVSENPDIRDRAYIYWRLLSSSPQATRVYLY
jgi:vesicle coat complex subunit